MIDKHPLLARKDKTRNGTYTYYMDFDPKAFYLADHVIEDRTLLPGVVYLEMVRGAANISGKHKATGLKDVAWTQPLTPKGEMYEAKITLRPEEKGLVYEVDAENAHHAEGVVLSEPLIAPEPLSLEPLMERLPELGRQEVYTHLKEMAFQYGPHFQSIDTWYGDEGEALAKLVLPKSLHEGADAFYFHPIMADGALQTAICLFDALGEPALPFSVDSVHFYAPTTPVCYAHAVARNWDPSAAFRVFDIVLYSEEGQPLAAFNGCTFKAPVAAPQPGEVLAQNVAAPPPTAAPTEGDGAQLRVQTLQFLTGVVAEALKVDASEINTRHPFAWYGVDSFTTLLVIKLLEDEFGSLRKTLLFENANLEALTDCFVSEHEANLRERFGLGSAAAPEPESAPAPAEVDEAPKTTGDGPLVMRSETAFADPVLSETLGRLAETYRGVLSVTFAASGISPFLFLGKERLGYFLFNTDKRSMLVWAYVGPPEYHEALTCQMLAYARAHGVTFNYVTHQAPDKAGDSPLTATPFGVFQHLGSLQDFTLDGKKMRRLRYMNSKFAKMGDAHTEEFKVGSDPKVTEAITAVIDAWSAKKGHVNPFIHVLREQIGKGSLSADFRLFTTYLDKRLECVVMVARLYDDQWLMDLEFYGEDMPLGGLEFTICNIVEQLRGEGHKSYSLGATWGPSLGADEREDPDLVAYLDGMRDRDDFGKGNFQFKNKFRTENEHILLVREPGTAAESVIEVLMMVANPPNQKTSDQPPEVPADLTFEVFESAEVGVVALDAEALDAEALDAEALDAEALDAEALDAEALDAEALDAPEQGETPAAEVAETWRPPQFDLVAPSQPLVDDEPRVDDDRALRETLLHKYGYNPVAIPAHEILYDLMTDSWAELDNPSITARVRSLEDQRGSTPDLVEVLQRYYPLPYLIPVASGRLAESYLAAAWPKGKKSVLQNPLFPTWIYHQLDKGFRPEELIHEAAASAFDETPFKGDFPLAALQARLDKDAASVAFVCLELANNAVGGHAVSRANLAAVKALLSQHGIPLVIDATRLLENAVAVARNEGRADEEMLAVNLELMAHADLVTASLTKDFGINVGGLIGLHDKELYGRIRDAVTSGGSGLNTRDHALIARAAADMSGVQGYVLARMKQTHALWSRLKEAGLPVASPAGVHCVLLDTGGFDALAGQAFPAQSLLAHIYRETGIRGGVHSAGMQRDTALNRMVRLAVPVGYSDRQMDAVGERLVKLLGGALQVPALAQISKGPGFFAEAKAVFAPAKASVPAAEVIPSKAAVTPKAAVPQKPQNTVTSPQRPVSVTSSSQGVKPMSSSSRDIAIVGLAGRYPQAKDLHQFWQNLVSGVDSIVEIPADRWDYRSLAAKGKPDVKWGSFVDNVDKFDSMFFSIAPKEAINMDPQERLFLEVAWEALEDAGYQPETLVPEGEKRDVGVFVGAVWTFYQAIGANEVLKGNVNGANSWLWAIPNRVSYYMDFTGPSFAVDTACSASLTALHLARESILRGECRAALAGGVNLDLHPTKRLILDNGGFLSPNGRCHAFGQKADGYVPGEGVGAVLLKPLDVAQRDGDYVYAVLKGSALNHGGLTNGFTVPSPVAQGQLIRAALDDSGIDARTISYLEAHGTGTKLGDPIEIQALSTAYRRDTPDTGFCAIGSVKSNIGHLEAAAGIAGLTKILLQFKHGRMVPSLHTETLNEYIDFEATPFRVQREGGVWEAPTVDGRKYPRRAGLSSFGAGGGNAHMILEEYQNPSYTDDAGSADFVLCLSARNEKQLTAYAQRYLDALETGQLDGYSMADICYTLQWGRRELKSRLAVVGRTRRDWAERLRDFVGEKEHPSVFSGNTKNAKAFTSFLQGADQAKVIDALVEDRNPHKLSRLWVDGVITSWLDLVAKNSGRRVPLPTYPFALETHWIGTNDQIPGQGIKPLHTLVTANESTFGSQKYRVVFDAEHWIFTDHVVGGLPTLPGVGYIEMFRAAGDLATGHKVTCIRNMVLSKPITSHECGSPMYLEMTPAGNEVSIEIVRYLADEDNERDVFGRARLGFQDTSSMPHALNPLDIDDLRKRLVNRKDPSEVYARMREGGTVHQPTYQTITEHIWAEGEALSRVEFRADLLGDFGDLELHPALMDAAGQSTITMWTEDGVAYVPFVMNDMHLFRPLQETGYIYIQHNGYAGRGHKFNITVTDDQGVICGFATDFTMMPFVVEEQHVMYFHPEWHKLDRLEAEREMEGPVLVFARDSRLVDALAPKQKAILVKPGGTFSGGDGVYEMDPLLPEHYSQLLKSLDTKPSGIIHCWSQQATSSDACLETGIYSMFHLVRALRESSNVLPLKVLFLHALGDGEVPENAAVGAFAKSINSELSTIDVAVIGLCCTNLNEDAVDKCDELLAELATPKVEAEVELQFRDEKRYVRQWRSFSPKADKDIPFVSEGKTYLLTGGAGGLGLIFAAHLAEIAPINLVLTGRSELSEEKQAAIDGIVGAGTVTYLRTDITNRKSVTKMVKTIKERFGELNGVLHAAGVLRDSYFWEKPQEDLAAVVAPKQRGTRLLDEATADQPLDFFILFSSVSGIKGNLGQCDYAYANAFMDAFAETREAARERGARQGKTVSINWPLWAEGGMEVDERIEKFLLRTWGMQPLETALGLSALHNSMGSDYGSFLVIQGDHDKLGRVFGPIRRKKPKAEPKPAAAAPAAAAVSAAPAAGGALDMDALQERLCNDMWAMIVDILGVSDEDADFDADMSAFGFDSLTFTDFTDSVNRGFGLEITPVIFFEYPTLGGMAGHICRQDKDILAKHYGMGAAPAAAGGAPEAAAPADGGLSFASAGFAPPAPAAAPAASAPAAAALPPGSLVLKNRPIAVIGMSGAMPQSENLDIFWENIVAERDLITEVPLSRWDWKALYGDNEDYNKSTAKWGGWMTEIDKFDARFFGISPREAEITDPQALVYLETCFAAVEDAGYRPTDLSGTNTGCYVGVGNYDYKDLYQMYDVDLQAYTLTGSFHSILINRVSYMLNITGPSIPIDTACSSALVAVHLAAEAMQLGHCEMALAGGVNCNSSFRDHFSIAKSSMLAEDGRCKTFDSRADGYTRSEGTGAILMKHLDAAERDGDRIIGLVIGSGTNHGGHTNTLTTPSPNLQAELLADTWRKTGVDPETITYLEAHGTGTSLGDPIEVSGMIKALTTLYGDKGKPLPSEKSVWIGSVKSNVGHLERAAGIAGVLKLLLCFQHRTLPASINIIEVNPYIKLEDTPLQIVRNTRPWDIPMNQDGQELFPRRAGVSSFGMGGVYGHIAMEEYIPSTPLKKPEPSTDPQLFVLSAKAEDRLRAYADRLASFLDKHGVGNEGGYKLPGRETLASELTVLAGQVVGVAPDDLDPNADMVDIGFDPMTITRFAKAIGDKYGYEPPGEFFSQHHTIDALAANLANLEEAGDDLGSDLDPAQIAFNLQLGRDIYDHRLAVVTADLSELKRLLADFAAGGAPTGLLHGAKKKGQKPALDNAEVKQALSARDWSALAKAFSSGAKIKFDDLYGEDRPMRMSLPTYPFARDRQWVDTTRPSVGAREVMDSGMLGGVSKLHPLLERNTSTLAEQRFATTFNGEEHFLKDHVVGNQRLLPGVAYLEMARAAGVFGAEQNVNTIKDTVWAFPVSVNGTSVETRIALYPENDRVAFEVSSGNGEMQHARGSLLFGEPIPAGPRRNLGALKARCPRDMDGAEFYGMLQKNGFDYGPTHRPISSLSRGENEALCEMRLPEQPEGLDAFVLHPSLMDGALQTVVALQAGSGEGDGPSCLPYAMGEVSIHGPLTDHCYAYAAQTRTQADMVHYDLEILSAGGDPLVTMKDFAVRLLDGKAGGGCHLFRPEWESKPAGRAVASQGALLLFDIGSYNRDLLARHPAQQGPVIQVQPGNQFSVEGQNYRIRPNDGVDYERLLESLDRSGHKLERILVMWSAPAMMDDAAARDLALERGLFTVFHMARALLARKQAHQVKLIHAWSGSPDERPLDAAVSGLLRTLSWEHPGLGWKSVVMGMGLEADALLQELSMPVEGYMVRLDTNGRQVRRLKPFMETGRKPLARENGVYLITGGAGALGLTFARRLAETQGVSLMLSGRSTPNIATNQAIDELKGMGAKVAYFSADVSRAEDVSALVKATRDNFGGLTGVIHAAGHLRDAFLIKKTEQDMRAVMAPKIDGTLFLDRETAGENLDFFVLFSSIASAMGNMGQADYAAGNAFMDAFAQWRNEQEQQGRRKGRSLALGWAMWEQGGMQVDAEALAWLRKNTGIAPMSNEAGLAALECALASSEANLFASAGDPARLTKVLGMPAQEPALPAEVESPSTPPASGDYRADMVGYLQALVSKETKIPAASIDADEELETYGIDSQLIMALNRTLEKDFGNLSRTIFFEYQTIQELVGYFAEQHAEAMARKFGKAGAQPKALPAPASALPALPEEPSAPLAIASRFPVSRQAQPEEQASAGGKAVAQNEVAIIGLGGRFPQAPDLNVFWENLAEGKDCIEPIPEHRWDHSRYYEEGGAPGRSNCRWGGFLEDMDQFDPKFFNISPREAMTMDPQERLFLETVQHTLEDGGYFRKRISGKAVGVFVGVMWGHYQLFGAEQIQAGNVVTPESSYASIANRISYFYNINGPSMAVDTMCSSSLAAIHLACHSLWHGDSEMAIAGGVNITVHPYKYLRLGMGNFTAADGRCRSFGEGGSGYVPGEGVGAVLLKSLDAALADGDYVYATIRGSALNHGGKTNGYTVPNPVAQGELIKKALERAGLEPGELGYLEAHGTGTSLGDPIEVSGLNRAFKGFNLPAASVPMGSVKSNVGHLESAAGIAAVAKVLLQMKHRKLVPSIHSDTLNSYIDFSRSPFFVQRGLTDWRRGRTVEGREVARIAGISSFGAGGANAHLILEDYEGFEPTPYQGEDLMFVLSALTRESLVRQASALLTYLKGDDVFGGSLADMAYTLQTGRESMPERLAIVVDNRQDLINQLSAVGEGVFGGVHMGKAGEESVSSRLLRGKAGAEFLKVAVRERELDQLAALWATGMDLDWEVLYPHHTPRRVPMPGYAFEKKRYWFDGLQRGAVPAAPAVPQAGSALPAQSVAAARPASPAVEPAAVHVPKPAPPQPAPVASARPKITLKATGATQSAPTPAPAPVQELRAPQPAAAKPAPPQPVKAKIEADERGKMVDHVRSRLTNMLATTLFLEEVDIEPNRPLGDLGLDSVLGVELMRQVNLELGINVAATVLYDYPDVNRLVPFLVDALEKAGKINGNNGDDMEEGSL